MSVKFIIYTTSGSFAFLRQQNQRFSVIQLIGHYCSIEFTMFSALTLIVPIIFIGIT